MFAFGCCAGGSGKLETGLLPSIREHWPDAPVLLRRSQTSIFDAYNSLLDEAAELAELEGLVLVHDDVVFRDGVLLDNLRDAFADPMVGLAGVVGGVGVREMSWWKSERLVGHVEHATSGHDEFTHGTVAADLIDGLVMAASPVTVQTLRIRMGGYPPWHGYDAELCGLVRGGGRRIVVVDADVFHDCKPGPWGRPEYGQALHEWRLRWTDEALPRRLVTKGRRLALAAVGRFGSP